MDKLTNFWKNNSISQAILMVLFCVSIIPIVIVSMVVINQSNVVLTDQMVENVQGLVQIRADEINATLAHAETAMIQMAPAVLSSLDAIRSVESSFDEGVEQINALFSALLATNTGAESLDVIFLDGNVYQIDDQGSVQLYRLSESEVQEMRQTAVSQLHTPQWIHQIDEPTLSLIMPLIDSDQKLLALFVQNFTIKNLYLTEIYGTVPTDAVAYFFMTPQGELISTLDSQDGQSSSQNLIAALTPAILNLSASEGGDSFQDEDGRNIAFISSPIAANGWSVGATVLTDEIVPMVSSGTRGRVLMLMMAEVVFVVLMAALLIRTIHRPLKLLAIGFQQVSEDGRAKRVAVDSFKELNQLAEAFNNMAAKVWERETTLKANVARLRIKIDMSKKKQELNSLVETDFFKELESNALRLRKQLKRENEQ